MNNQIFVDSFAWIAIINKSDNYHQVCVDLLNKLLKQQAKLLTTNYILIETINALSKAELLLVCLSFQAQGPGQGEIHVIVIGYVIHVSALRE